MINKEIKICILGGGWSNEREISLKSSNDVYSCLRKNNHNVIYYDMVSDSASKLETFLKENSVELVFNLIHGEGGEDGTVQSYLDSFGIAYCGSGTESSKISFNKYQTKRIWSDNNLSTPDYEIYHSQSYDYCKEKYGTSFFIKDTWPLCKPPIVGIKDIDISFIISDIRSSLLLNIFISRLQ